jgi:hypothetical protein
VVRVPFLKSQIASQFTNQQRGKATLDEIEMNGGYVWDQTCFKALTYPTKPTLWRTANLLDVRSSWLPYDITVPIFQSRGVLPLMLTTCWSSLICTLTRRCATQMSWRIIEIPDLKHFIPLLKLSSTLFYCSNCQALCSTAQIVRIHLNPSQVLKQHINWTSLEYRRHPEALAISWKGVCRKLWGTRLKTARGKYLTQDYVESSW